jgi:CRISPR-associated protein Csd1
MEKLYQTYEHAIKLEATTPWAVSHFVKTAHIEVVIDGNGNIKKDRITLLSGDDSLTLIPATEASAGRAGAIIAPHPLCDEIGYCASDFPDAIKARSEAYLNRLKEWCLSEYTHPKIRAIHKYLEKQSLWQDLSQALEFPISFTNRRGQKTRITADKTFVRWRVEEAGNPCSGTWEDTDLIEKWIQFDKSKNLKTGRCFITGDDVRLIENHSRFIRHSGDGAKLISSNDNSGYTYRGKFLDKNEACGIGFDVSQKAHNALRWLIARQGFKNGDKDPQVYVSWAVSGKPIPEPLSDADTLFKNEEANLEEVEDDETQLVEAAPNHAINLGQTYANKLKKYMAGYAAKLDPNEQIIIMGIDSATPGRMGIIYYRELLSHEFLERLKIWHTDFAWYQRHTQIIPTDTGKKPKTKVIFPISSPLPKDIATAAYGDNVNDSLKKKVIERLLPCIIDGSPFPLDLVISCVRKATNRVGYASDAQWLWEKNLGIACALYKGYYARHPNLTQRRQYAMALEENYLSRDYLFGRLLAIAERIEDIALSVSDENRPTTAARLMQRFADRPYETWRTIELALQPYIQRLRTSRAGFLSNQLEEMDSVLSLFQHDDFMRKEPLSGEFLLGYHCQRQKIRADAAENAANYKAKQSKDKPESTDTTPAQGNS